VTRRRLDTELVRRGLVSSRSEAQAAVDAGLVTVAGAPATKPATLVAPGAALTLEGTTRPFASRAGSKLAAALERFDVLPQGRVCLDAGASTGGFTDCLLQAGAALVIAVDVGYGQLAWKLRTDPRVVVMERTNVRALTPGDLEAAPDLLVADLSFISLTLVLPTLARLAPELVVLVKPQFEAGKEQVGKGGVVRDPHVWARVLRDVATVAQTEGLGVVGAMASPLPGPAGNVEFLLHLARGASSAADLDAAVEEGREVAP
jgi:23S rRNA (cytidine1920-2'-O)/16S rRNA (cytidine1409-2'-O)-methyltransferase